MIIKASDFKGKYYIANAHDNEPDGDILDSVSSKVGNNLSLNELIKVRVEEALIFLLGFELYYEFKSEFKSDLISLKDNSDQKYVKLLNGHESYLGLKNILIPYVYYYWLEQEDESLTGLGTKKLNSKASENVSSRPKAISAWRDFYNLSVGHYNLTRARDFGITHTALVFRNKFGYGIIHGSNNGKKSLYSYLQENKSDFNNWSPSIIRNKNQFDI